MFGEYGYMEEGRLGKPYNLKLLRRLIPYAAPYRKVIISALVLTILTTLIDLTFPYLSKVAIDRYILCSWYLLDRGRMTPKDMEDLAARYGRLLEPTKDGSFLAINHQR